MKTVWDWVLVLVLVTGIWPSFRLLHVRAERGETGWIDEWDEDKNAISVLKRDVTSQGGIDEAENEIVVTTAKDPPGKLLESTTIENENKPVTKPSKITSTSSEEGQDADVDDNSSTGRIIFVTANTDVGRKWEEIPFREKYMWDSADGPCHRFKLSVPREKDHQGILHVCLYRRNIGFNNPGQKKLSPELAKAKHKVYGRVEGYSGSVVAGHIIDKAFYGNISLGDTDEVDSLYVVDTKKVLVQLMGHSRRLLRALQIPYRSKYKEPLQTQNAVVTVGDNLRRFLPQARNRTNHFLVLSTGHDSFLFYGSPTLAIDEKDRIVFTVKNEVVTVGTDGLSVSWSNTSPSKLKDREYKFHPNGKTILLEGFNATTLEEEEGAIGIAAVSENLKFGCVLPSLAFSKDNRPGGFVCKVCVGLDDSFNKNFRFPKNATNNSDDYDYDMLARVLDRVAWIFRSIDWNEDGEPDDIGIIADPEYFRWDNSYLDGEEITPEELDESLSRLSLFDFSECCLGLVYTMKKFPADIFAVASPTKPLTQSGICAHPTDDISRNIILISANSRSSNYTPMSPDELVYVTAHEIGKAFGGPLDGTGDPKCDSFEDKKGVTRRFLLWPNPLRPTVPEERKFSPCAITSIKSMLETCRSSCFEISAEPFCGNGIVEEGEECDCGGELKCSKQKCCFPRYGQHPCQFTGAECHRSRAYRKQLTLGFISSLLIMLALLQVTA